MPSGGKRPGAGRPNKKRMKQERRKRIQELDPYLPDFLAKVRELALDGSERMLMYAIDRIQGKPTETTRHEAGADTSFQVIINRTDGQPIAIGENGAKSNGHKPEA